MNTEMWLIWKDPKSRRRYKVGTLIEYGNRFVFKYDANIEEAQKVGFDFFPGFDNLDEKYSSNKLFANIRSRLPNVARPDYKEILQSYGLNENNTEMEILKMTRGRLITDDFEFVIAFNNEFIEFDVAGTKYQDDLKKCKNELKIGENLILKLEKENKYDENAILIIYDKTMQYKIGYVPRYYSKYLAKLLKKEVKYEAKISRLNLGALINDELISVRVELQL